MENVIIGTAGHVDHGKTCLIKALTGIDTDRLIEEKKRGITIELGFAYLHAPDGSRLGIIDVPGHEKFIKNMLAGSGGIDLALLIVAADEGVMPQTREHIGILKLLGIKDGIIVITKCDTVDEEFIELVKDDIAGEVAGSFLENSPIIAVSAFTGKGIDELREKIFDTCTNISSKNDTQPYRVPVDRIFTVDGFGTVITGTLLEGRMSVDDSAMIYPSQKVVKIRNLQVHNSEVECAFAGQRVAVNLANVKKEELFRGAVIAQPDSMRVTKMLDVCLKVLENSDRTIKNGSKLHFYHGSNETLCRVSLLDREELQPGEKCYAQLHFSQVIAAKLFDRFIVRFYSPLETIGGGEILNPFPKKHSRSDAAVISSLDDISKKDPRLIAYHSIDQFSSSLEPIEFIASHVSMTLDEIIGIVEALHEQKKVIYISPNLYVSDKFYASIQNSAKSILTEYHASNPLKAGMKREEFRTKLLQQVNTTIADSFIEILSKDKSIKIFDGSISLPSFKPVVNNAGKEIWDKIAKTYENAGFVVPSRDEIQAMYPRERNISKIIDAMIDDGILVRIDAQILLHSSHYERALSFLREYILANGEITLAQFRDLLGASRKYAVAILELWDRKGITKKIGDVRKLN